MRIHTQYGILLDDPTPMVHGMGATTNASIASIAAQGATTTASILGGISAATTAAGSGLLAGATVFGMAASAAIPLIGVAIAGLTAIGIAIAKAFAGCGQTCVEASNIANQVGDIMSQNVHTYMAAPIHYASLQAAALNNFDVAWAALEQACGNPQLTQAGQNCISDRQQGACTWKSSPGGWSQDSTGKWNYTWAGPAGSGSACWNYFIGMRDPIANDPTVVPDPVGAIVDPVTGNVTGINPVTAATSTVTTDVASVVNSVPVPLLLAGAGLALYMMLD